MIGCRNAFGLDREGPSDGKSALHTVLTELHFFLEAENEEDMYLQNAAKRILRDCGIWRESKSGDITFGLSTIPPLYPDEGEDDE